MENYHSTSEILLDLLSVSCHKIFPYYGSLTATKLLAEFFF